MKRILAALAASGILIAGGFVAATVSTPTTASAQESGDDQGVEEAPNSDRASHIDEVFEDLVADGVITQEQVDAIKEAFAAKRAELQEQREALRAERQELREQVRAALEDGVLDADELAALPDGNPFTDPDGPFAEYLDDGQLTVEELREARPDRGRGHRGHRGFGGADSVGAADTATDVSF